MYYISLPVCSITCPDSHSGHAASCVRPVVTGCDRAGPRAPARQMVVRIILCPCLEGREDQENQPNPGFPRNPSLAPLPLLSTVCSIFLPTHPPPNQHPLNRVYLQCTRTPGPRAPARQMVVRIILCPCLEGREDQENQPNLGRGAGEWSKLWRRLTAPCWTCEQLVLAPDGAELDSIAICAAAAPRDT